MTAIDVYGVDFKRTRTGPPLPPSRWLTGFVALVLGMTISFLFNAWMFQ
jgi:hypothetical protein